MSAAEGCESYTTVCRLCMQHDGFMLGIFNHIQGKERSIYKKIIDCTTLEVAFGDGLPNSICHRCLFKIEFCLEFRQQCFISDATFRQINGLSQSVPSILPPQAGTGDVVMVVDPNTSYYESDYESDVGNPPSVSLASVEHPLSDVETLDANDAVEFKNVHMCQYCDRAFSERAECSRHETERHDPDTPYQCSICEQNYADRNAYTTHLRSAHQNDKPYGCPECERGFARRSDLRKHTIVHTGVKPFTCPICYKSFSRNTNLSKHIRIHKGHKPFVCASCPRTFMSKVELDRHAAQHSRAKPFQCDMCDMGFTRKDKLARHRKRHLPQENVKDVALELQAMRENLMNEYGMPDFAIAQDSNDNHIDSAPPMHELAAGTMGDAGVVAARGEDGWPSTENMIINVDPFSNDKMAQDGLMHKHEAGPDADEVEHELSEEQDEEHTWRSASPEKQDPDGDPNPDDDAAGRNDGKCCAMSHHDAGEYPSSADTNEESEQPERYPCTLCNKTFRSADGLKLHMGLHNGKRPFGCKVCGKAFLRRRELERHGATHTGVKQFECPRCQKRFSRKDKLLRHTRIHDMNRERCMLCPATFNRKDGLAQHMKTHGNDENAVF